MGLGQRYNHIHTALTLLLGAAPLASAIHSLAVVAVYETGSRDEPALHGWAPRAC